MTPRKLTANFVETDVDDETLIVDMDGGLLFSLSGTGRAVWKAVDGERSKEAIARLMVADFAGDEAEIAGDIERLLRDLAGARLVELQG